MLCIIMVPSPQLNALFYKLDMVSLQSNGTMTQTDGGSLYSEGGNTYTNAGFPLLAEELDAKWK